MQRRKTRPYFRPPLPPSRNDDNPVPPSPGYAPGPSPGYAPVSPYAPVPPSPGYAPVPSYAPVPPSLGYAPRPSPGYVPPPPSFGGMSSHARSHGYAPVLRSVGIQLGTIVENETEPSSPKTPSDGYSVIVALHEDSAAVWKFERDRLKRNKPEIDPNSHQESRSQHGSGITQAVVIVHAKDGGLLQPAGFHDTYLGS
ncbi:hypothetical protein R1sor_001244 [Riccia sorocarpa]|uniref:Uncharacterized protein n=1 Tax=Riccia sorocarpa TaxID=122646 RepID=A0ABD3GVE3_9MARC